MDKLLPVIIGIIGALLGVYVREALTRAHQQKAVATRIEAYLLIWMRKVQESESWLKLHLIGQVIQDDMVKVALQDGLSGLFVEDKKYKEMLTNLYDELISGDDFKNRYENIVMVIKNEPEPLFAHFIEEATHSRIQLYDGTRFVSDFEAAQISWYAGHQLIEIKQALCDLFDGLIDLWITCRHTHEPSQQLIGAMMFRIVKSMIGLGKLHFPFLKYAGNVRKRSLFSLTLANLIGIDP